MTQIKVPLSVSHPHLAAEADGWDPVQVSHGSQKNLSWRCALGHLWEAAPHDRSSTRRGTGCPFCANRRVWPGFNDLATIYPNLAKQANGWDPATVIAGSASKLGWRCTIGHEWEATVDSRTQHIDNTGCPYCANQRTLKGYNDLATTHPNLAKEAYGWDPATIVAGSHQRLSWICSEGHVWDTFVYKRSSGQGCPFCRHGSRVWSGYNDMATTHPDIAAQAYGWDPTTIVASTARKLPWICSEGHVWETRGDTRVKGSGCPTCAKYGYNPSEPGWLYLLVHLELDLLQIGISNIPEVRLKKHYRRGWEMLDLRGPMDGILTKDWETSILRMLHSKSVDFASVRGEVFDGYTESWLRESFPVTLLSELMDTVHGWECECSAK